MNSQAVLTVKHHKSVSSEQLLTLLFLLDIVPEKSTACSGDEKNFHLPNRLIKSKNTLYAVVIAVDGGIIVDNVLQCNIVKIICDYFVKTFPYR